MLARIFKRYNGFILITRKESFLFTRKLERKPKNITNFRKLEILKNVKLLVLFPDPSWQVRLDYNT